MKVVAGRHFDEHGNRLASRRDAHSLWKRVGRELAEHAVRIAEVFVVRIGDLQDVAERRAVLRIGRVDGDKFLWLVHRQRVEEQRVDKREDGRIQADAETERKDRGRGECRRPHERANCEPNVLPKPFHIQPGGFAPRTPNAPLHRA